MSAPRRARRLVSGVLCALLLLAGCTHNPKAYPGERLPASKLGAVRGAGYFWTEEVIFLSIDGEKKVERWRRGGQEIHLKPGIYRLELRFVEVTWTTLIFWPLLKLIEPYANDKQRRFVDVTIQPRTQYTFYYRKNEQRYYLGETPLGNKVEPHWIDEWELAAAPCIEDTINWRKMYCDLEVTRQRVILSADWLSEPVSLFRPPEVPKGSSATVEVTILDDGSIVGVNVTGTENVELMRLLRFTGRNLEVDVEGLKDKVFPHTEVFRVSF